MVSTHGRWSAHPFKGGRKLGQGLVQDELDAPDGMMLVTRTSGVTGVSMVACRAALPLMGTPPHRGWLTSYHRRSPHNFQHPDREGSALCEALLSA